MIGNSFYFILILVLIHSCSIDKKSVQDKPNFVIIFTDDQGYGDLSCFGGDHVYTPNIDKMAEEGARLTSFYVAAPLCTHFTRGAYDGLLSQAGKHGTTIELSR